MTNLPPWADRVQDLPFDTPADVVRERLDPNGEPIDPDQIVWIEDDLDAYPAGWSLVTLTLPCRACHLGRVRFMHEVCPECGAPTPWAGLDEEDEHE